ncbi:SpcZ [Streptomyces sp. NPDC088725]|uniref:SpcZ n=1 Tax=Streptomyces sp. NPDC088725 TaxID=3365873 RepID=UPI0038037878
MSQPPAAAEAFDRFLVQLEAGSVGSLELFGPAGGDAAPGAGPDADHERDVPAWPAQVVSVLFNGQDAAGAKGWARRVHTELVRLDGHVPFTVVHDWHAGTVMPLLAEANERHGEGAGAQQAVQRLHARAATGERVAEDEWRAALGPALREVYRHAYAYEDAFATASANARAYATANGYDEDKAVAFGETYATLNTTANATSYADANALANTAATASAYAAADARAYAEAYPFASVHAYALAHAHAHTGQDEAAERDERLRVAYGRLADGLADSLARAAGGIGAVGTAGTAS